MMRRNAWRWLIWADRVRMRTVAGGSSAPAPVGFSPAQAADFLHPLHPRTSRPAAWFDITASKLPIDWRKREAYSSRARRRCIAGGGLRPAVGVTRAGGEQPRVRASAL